MPRPAPRTARSLAATAMAAVPFLCVLFLVLVVGNGGCEVAVGDTVPAFACEQGTGDTCPPNQMCDSTNRCVPCPASGCGSMTMTADSGAGDEVSVNDTGAPLDTSMPDTATMPDTSMPVDTGTVETASCRGLGCPCSSATECDSQICADSLTVTAALNGVAGNFCTQPCCTSADCDGNTVCFATGQGGDYCVEPAWLMRGTAIGAGGGGATCSTNRDCRSALCDTAAGKCVDTCCSSASATQCTGGESCQFGKFAGAPNVDQNYSASCAPGTGGSQDGSNCSSSSTCQSKLCAQDVFGNDCHGVCRGTDCASGESCQYVLTGSGTPTPVVAACFSSTGTQAAGTACSTSNDMCSGFCDPTARVCTNVCFSDSDCMSGWRCRPETVSPQGGGSYSVLACGT